MRKWIVFSFFIIGGGLFWNFLASSSSRELASVHEFSVPPSGRTIAGGMADPHAGLIPTPESRPNYSLRTKELYPPEEDYYCPPEEKMWPEYTQSIIKNLSDPKRVNFYSQAIQQCLAKNPSRIGETCTSNLIQFAKNIEKESLGLLKSWKEPKPLVLPSVFDSEEYKRSWKKDNYTQDQLDRAMKGLQARLPPGSKTIQFHSAVTPTPMLSFTTFIPGEDQDIKVHFHGTEGALILRFVKKENGKELTPPRMEFFSHYDGVTQTSAELHNHCVACHRTGEPAILPVPGTVVSHVPGMDAKQLKDWFNDRRVIYAQPFDIKTDHLGPPIGPDEAPWRDDEFINECSEGITPSLDPREKHIVKSSMNCVGCHKEEGLGDIHLKYPTHIWEFGFSVFDNTILSAHMPSKSKFPLNQQMRKALLKCLKYEYFGGFTDKEYSQGNTKPGILQRSLKSPNCSLEYLNSTPDPNTLEVKN